MVWGWLRWSTPAAKDSPQIIIVSGKSEFGLVNVSGPEEQSFPRVPAICDACLAITAELSSIFALASPNILSRSS